MSREEQEGREPRGKNLIIIFILILVLVLVLDLILILISPLFLVQLLRGKNKSQW